MEKIEKGIFRILDVREITEATTYNDINYFTAKQEIKTKIKDFICLVAENIETKERRRFNIGSSCSNNDKYLIIKDDIVEITEEINESYYKTTRSVQDVKILNIEC